MYALGVAQRGAAARANNTHHLGTFRPSPIWKLEAELVEEAEFSPAIASAQEPKSANPDQLAVTSGKTINLEHHQSLCTLRPGLWSN